MESARDNPSGRRDRVRPAVGEDPSGGGTRSIRARRVPPRAGHQFRGDGLLLAAVLIVEQQLRELGRSAEPHGSRASHAVGAPVAPTQTSEGDRSTSKRAPPAVTSASPNPRLRSIVPTNETRLPTIAGHAAESARGDTATGFSQAGSPSPPSTSPSPAACGARGPVVAFVGALRSRIEGASGRRQARPGLLQWKQAR